MGLLLHIFAAASPNEKLRFARFADGVITFQSYNIQTYMGPWERYPLPHADLQDPAVGFAMTPA